jgi:hypothetical protein
MFSLSQGNQTRDHIPCICCLPCAACFTTIVTAVSGWLRLSLLRGVQRGWSSVRGVGSAPLRLSDGGPGGGGGPCRGSCARLCSSTRACAPALDNWSLSSALVQCLSLCSSTGACESSADKLEISQQTGVFQSADRPAREPSFTKMKALAHAFT